MQSIVLTKLISLLLYPLSLSFLLVVPGVLLLWLGWRRSGLTFSLLGLGWLYLCSTAVFSHFLMGTLERDYVSRAMSVVPEVDAIVLLGGAMRGHTHMGTRPDLNQQADRLVHAVALYKAGKAPYILVTGGSVTGDRSEAMQMRDVLEVMGVPRRRILMEHQSRNTYENAVYTARILKDKGIDQVLLVTSAFHMPRAHGVFLRQNVDVIPAPTDYQRVTGNTILPGGLPSVRNLQRTTHALHEIAGFWAYRWQGWL